MFPRFGATLKFLGVKVNSLMINDIKEFVTFDLCHLGPLPSPSPKLKSQTSKKDAVLMLSREINCWMAHLSFLELLNCGAHCHPLLSLNPTICHLFNLPSTNLILSPSLLKLPHLLSFSFVGALL